MKNLTFLCACIVAALPAQQVYSQVVDLPSLSIEESRLDSRVTFDQDRNVYIYHYEVVAHESNKAPIVGFSVDVRGRNPRPQTDPDLHENIERRDRQVQPNTTLPVGVIVPDPGVPMLVGPNLAGYVAFSYWSSGPYPIPPGTSRDGFVIESKFPPAWREAVLRPSEVSWLELESAVGSGVEYSWKDWDLKTEVLAPYDLDESTLYDGGGQSPREVNPFLRYESPVESRVHLPGGTEQFDVTVLFGPTTDPATFLATLDGENITSWFRPMAGVMDTVTIPLKLGTTKLKLEIVGTTSSGRSARDSDTLTFIVK